MFFTAFYNLKAVGQLTTSNFTVLFHQTNYRHENI